MFTVFEPNSGLSGRSLDGEPSTLPQLPVKRSRRRDKPQLSCTNCRQKKLRCDRVKPCLNCSKRGHPESCDYVKQPPTDPRPTRPQGTVQLQDRIQQLEDTVKNLLNGQTISAGTPRAAPIDDGAFTSSAAASPFEQTDPNTPRASSGIFTKGKDQANFVGSEHWEAILEDIAELKIDLETPDTSEKDDFKPQILFGMNQASRSEIMSSIPSRQVCDMLISRFFKTMDMAPMIVHVPTFMKEYDRMFSEPDETPLMWVGLLFSVLGLACLFYSVSEDKLHTMPEPFTSMLEMSRHYRDRTAQCLVEVNYLRPKPYTVTTLCFYHALEKFQSSNSEFGEYVVLGIIIRVAMRLGYHRDASHYPSITPFDGEMRRRTWTMIFQLDLVAAAQVGLPRMIREEETDTAEPKNLLDSDLDEDMTELPQPRPNTEVTPVAFAVFMVRILRQLGVIVDKINSINPPVYEEVLRLDSKLLETHASLPPSLTMRNLGLSVLDDASLILRRCALEACFQKSRCVLHRKYLILGKTNPQFQYSRNASVDAAMSLMDVQYMVDEASKPGGQLFGEQWRTSALVNQDYVLAAMILCLDLAWDSRTENRGILSDQADGIESKWPRARRLQALKTSYDIWCQWTTTSTLAGKAVETLKVMLKNLEPKDHAATVFSPSSTSQSTNVDIFSNPSNDESHYLETGLSSSTSISNPTKLEPTTLPPQNFFGIGQSTEIPPAMDFVGTMDTDMNFDWDLWDNQFRNSTMPMVMEDGEADYDFGFDFNSLG